MFRGLLPPWLQTDAPSGLLGDCRHFRTNVSPDVYIYNSRSVSYTHLTLPTKA